MEVLLTGASGLIGSALTASLRAEGHRVEPLLRTSKGRTASPRTWDPSRGQLHPAALSGVDAIVHLQGEPITGRWSASKKRRMRASRVDATQLLCSRLRDARPQPRVLVAASAVGYYGDRGDEVLTEASEPGEGFLPELCRDWENASLAARDVGLRVVLLRVGLVMTPRGGALAKMLGPFRYGLGARLGNGKQYQPWITLDDVIGVIRLAISNENLDGPINTVAPEAVTNATFTRTLARVLRRPAPFVAPPSLLRLLLGEIADAGLLASARVVPERLLSLGFVFRDPQLEQALRRVLW